MPGQAGGLLDVAAFTERPARELLEALRFALDSLRDEDRLTFAGERGDAKDALGAREVLRPPPDERDVPALQRALDERLEQGGVVAELRRGLLPQDLLAVRRREDAIQQDGHRDGEDERQPELVREPHPLRSALVMQYHTAIHRDPPGDALALTLRVITGIFVFGYLAGSSASFGALPRTSYASLACLTAELVSHESAPRFVSHRDAKPSNYITIPPERQAQPRDRQGRSSRDLATRALGVRYCLERCSGAGGLLRDVRHATCVERLRG